MVNAELVDGGSAHGAEVAQFLAANDAENISLGIELDVRHDESPVVAGLPVEHLLITDPAVAQLYRHRLVLIRPDLHVAWSGTDAADAAEIIAQIRGMQPATVPAHAGA
jgi:hypothetical protein